MSGRPPDAERVRREGRGRLAEYVAAAFLMLHGYRVLQRRAKTPHGEIDIIARRGRRITFVEVKYRRTRQAAEDALTFKQAQRVAKAAEHWISKRLAYEDYQRGFDAILVLPWRWPILIPDAYEPLATSGRMW